jgi:protein SCO1/2
LAVLSLLALALLGLAACGPSRPPLEDYGAGPSFALTDQTGKRFGSADAQGRVVVATFIYTRCTDACPLITAKMRDVQEKLKSSGLFGSDVLLLSITVDPDYDTPERLAAYGEKFHVDASGWRFLTGDTDVIHQLLQNGFKVGAPVPNLTPRGDDPAFDHSTRFILIDRAYHVRAVPIVSDVQPDDLITDIRGLAER